MLKCVLVCERERTACVCLFVYVLSTIGLTLKDFFFATSPFIATPSPCSPLGITRPSNRMNTGQFTARFDVLWITIYFTLYTIPIYPPPLRTSQLTLPFLYTEKQIKSIYTKPHLLPHAPICLPIPSSSLPFPPFPHPPATKREHLATIATALLLVLLRRGHESTQSGGARAKSRKRHTDSATQISAAALWRLARI